MMEFDGLAWLVVIVSSGMIGFSKAGIPGAGVLVVPLLASIMPARESTGFLLPLLCVGDIVAIIYWRRHVDWQKLGRLLPWTMAGIVAGYFWLGHITDEQLMPLIGLVVLSMIGLSHLRKNDDKDKAPSAWWIACFIGMIAGCASMMANAAGPIIVIYMLAMGMKKKEIIGTQAWFFWILNLSKTPFSHNLDLINGQTLLTGLVLVPAILAGGALGIFFAHRIPQRLFNIVVEVLAGITCLSLCVRALIAA